MTALETPQPPRPYHPYQPGPAQERGSRWSGGRIALAVFGVVLAVIASVALTGGGYALWAENQRDSSGYLTTSMQPFDTDTYAMTAGTLDIGGSGPDALIAQNLLGDIRITIAGADPDQEVFVGIALADAVSGYLTGVGHDVLDDVEISPFDATYRPEPGSSEPPGPPTAQTFWKTTATGPGAQTLTWQVQPGDWSVLVMNADGTAGVHASLSVGATLPIVKSLSIWLLVGGGLLLLVAIAMVSTAALMGRRRS